MKKFFSIILLAVILLMCSGCATAAQLLTRQEEPAAPTPETAVSPDVTPTPKPEPTAAPTPEPEPTESPEQLLTIFSEYITLLNDCFSETCGAVLDESTVYSRVYTNSDAMLNGDAPIDVVPRDSLTEVTDPTDAILFEITNFTTNADARAYLETYFTPVVTDQVFPNQFLEFNGKLYMVYGSRGYGGHEYDAAAAQITELTEEHCTVTAPVYWFESYTGDATLTFEKIDGHWYLTEFAE